MIEKKIENFHGFCELQHSTILEVKADILIKTVENVKDGVKRCLSKKYYN